MSRFEYVVKPPPGDVNPFLAAADPTKTWCQKFGKQAIEVAITLGVNVVLPIIIVQVLKATTDLSDARRVLFSGVPSVLHAILGLIFRRKLDIVAGLNILSVLWTLLIMALWPGDARLLLLNQSFPTALIGLISLASVFALTYVCTERDIRPLTYYFGREAAALGDENKAIWCQSNEPHNDADQQRGCGAPMMPTILFLCAAAFLSLQGIICTRRIHPSALARSWRLVSGAGASCWRSR